MAAPTPPFPLSGSLVEWDFPDILYHVYELAISGCLKITTATFEKALFISGHTVQFATSNLAADNLGQYLRRLKIIDDKTLKRCQEHMKKSGVRLGRALQELAVIDHDELWEYVAEHQRKIVYSLFPLSEGTFAIGVNTERLAENISLAADVPALIAEGIRQIRDSALLQKRLASLPAEFFSRLNETIGAVKLSPPERHVLDMVRKYRTLKKILNHSELLAFPTRRTLYLLWRLRLIGSTPEAADGTASTAGHVPQPARRTFESFENALAYYNAKYISIYKLLSKEIGPVALSILGGSVAEIQDNIPSYFQGLKINPQGGLDEESLLKALWYLDFETHSADFLKGLEEILYAEIFTIKKHLGKEYEKLVLQWIGESGN